MSRPNPELAMCYSAEVFADYRLLCKEHGATMSLKAFAALWERIHDVPAKRPKTVRAMDLAFVASTGKETADIRTQLQAWDEEEAGVWEQELFTQKTRLNRAERALETKITKKAQEDVRIAGNKIERAMRKIAALRNREMGKASSRIFPGVHGPVIISSKGKRLVVPMRYQCRPAGKPASYDRRYPGTYNARRDNLEGFWAGQFGHTHAVMVASRFYENVEGPNGENQVLEFQPRTGEPMLIACLWSHWKDPKSIEPDLLSFAAITDEPEPEVAAAGHDRTIVNIKPEHLDAWLNPDPRNLDALYAILDDKRHPFYEHRIAA